MMIIPIIIPPAGGGRGRGPSGKSMAVTLVVMVVSAPAYAFLIAGAVHFMGWNVDRILYAWYGFPVVIAVVGSYFGAVIVTVMAVAEVVERKWP